MTSRRSASASKDAEGSRSSAAAAAAPSAADTAKAEASESAEPFGTAQEEEQQQQDEEAKGQQGKVKDETAGHDQQQEQQSRGANGKGETETGLEGEADAEMEEEGEATSSGQGSDASAKGVAKGKNKPSSKRKVKGAAASARAARIAKSHQKGKSADRNSDEGAVGEEEEEGEEELAATRAADEASGDIPPIKAEDTTGDGGAADEAERAPESRSHSSEIGQSSRTRSASTFKELAGLGLGKLGDGEEEPLMPRRSRRSGASPNNTKPTSGDSGNDEDEEIHTHSGGRPQRSLRAPQAESENQVGGGSADAEAGGDRQEKEDDAGDEEDEEDDSKAKPETEGTAIEGEASEAENGSIGQAQEPSGFDEEEVNEEGVTRCVCGSADENVGLMIQCETCKCWQHCICMGMHTEDDCPDVYFCEQCRPELHIPLLRTLGVLPPPRSHKKGASKVQGRNVSRDSTRELREAKEAVLNLAKENERRRKEGVTPVTGWSVAQGQSLVQHTDDEYGSLQDEGNGVRRSSSTHRRQISEARQNRNSRSQSRDEEHGGRPHNTPKSPPKRRSTMNSRDSAYGWEPIPPGLLNEDESWEGPRSAHSSSNKFELDEERSSVAASGKKRKRQRGSGEGDEGEEYQAQSPSMSGAGAGPGAAEDGGVKRMKVERQPNDSAVEEEGDEEEEEAEEAPPENGEPDEGQLASSNADAQAQAQASATKKNSGGAKRAKHPNQYTARRALAAANAGNGGHNGSSSPSPSKRHLDSTRRAALRDSTAASRVGTPTPGENAASRNMSHPGGSWGMPEHLSHLAWLLPKAAPEPLNIHVPSSKGASGSQSRNNAAAAAMDAANSSLSARAGQRLQASPQPFHVVALQESSTKVRFPAKRTTMGEMRKRVRNISDYVTRIQIEAAEREKRMRFLGIRIEEDALKEKEKLEAMKEGEAAIDKTSSAEEGGKNDFQDESATVIVDQDGDAQMEGKDGQSAIVGAQEGEKGDRRQGLPATSDLAPASAEIPASKPSEKADEAARSNVPNAVRPAIGAESRATDMSLSSMLLVDELTRELVLFQAKYGTAGLSF